MSSELDLSRTDLANLNTGQVRVDVDHDLSDACNSVEKNASIFPASTDVEQKACGLSRDRWTVTWLCSTRLRAMFYQ